MRRKAYSARNVNQVDVSKMIVGREGHPVWVGLDVGKRELMIVAEWADKDFERPWAVANPLGIRCAIGKLKELGRGREMVIAMEPSGTYGDAFRQAAAEAGLVLHQVKTKVAHDRAESFDGVPSQHDGKDAAVVADLARIGSSRPWPFERPDAWQQQLEYWVNRMDMQRRVLAVWTGRLEAKLARHWPEALGLLKCTSGTLLRVLQEYASPAELGRDPQAASKLRRWSRDLLSEEKVKQLLESAATTVGVGMHEWDTRALREYAQNAQAARKEMRLAARRLAQLAIGRSPIQAMGQAVGVATACVLWLCLGDPHNYPCAQAYAKAMGLNLCERSSGMYKGRLKISKRGFGLVRYWMYLAAMRLLKETPVKAWFLAKKGRDGQKGGKATVAVMRRLGLALWHVGACGEAFEPWRLFPGGQRRQKGR